MQKLYYEMKKFGVGKGDELIQIGVLNTFLCNIKKRKQKNFVYFFKKIKGKNKIQNTNIFIRI